MEQSAMENPVPAIRMMDAAAGAMQDLSRPVVEHINWEVSTGDYWAVAGLQGSGKTDFMMMVGGVTAPVAGHYWLYGEEMPIFDEPRLRQRLQLGLVFENGQLLNHLTVRENVALPVRYHENLTLTDAYNRVSAMLEALDLGPWADSTPGAIGRNWQKRVGLARALMLRPRLLLVDNPLGGLDFVHSQWWLGFFDQLSKGHPALEDQPVTVVVTTADLRPWKGRARQFGLLTNRQLIVARDWQQMQNAGDTLLSELLAVEHRET